eukprot:13961983-Alexandrium_andersonii.AAC.1
MMQRRVPMAAKYLNIRISPMHPPPAQEQCPNWWSLVPTACRMHHASHDALTAAGCARMPADLLSASQ